MSSCVALRRTIINEDGKRAQPRRDISSPDHRASVSSSSDVAWRKSAKTTIDSVESRRVMTQDWFRGSTQAAIKRSLASVRVASSDSEARERRVVTRRRPDARQSREGARATVRWVDAFGGSTRASVVVGLHFVVLSRRTRRRECRTKTRTRDRSRAGRTRRR